MQPVIAANGLIEQVIPGAFATWRAEAAPTSTSASGDRVLAVLGQASGGIPGQPYLFTQNDDKLTKTLQSGELLQAVRFALGLGVAGVVAVNPTPGTPATYELQGEGEGVFGTLTTQFYRESANQTRLTLVGNAKDGYAIEVTNGLTGTNVTSNRVGLGLYLTYNGAGTATAEVIDGINGRALKISVTGGDNEDLEIPLADLTIEALIRRIQDSGPYSALYSRDARLAADGLDVTLAPVNINAYPVVATYTAAAKGATTLTVTALARKVASGETLRVRSLGAWVPVRVTEDAETGATSLKVMPLSAAIEGGNLFSAKANPLVALSAVKADFELFFATRASAAVSFTAGAATMPATQSGYFTGGASLDAAPEDWSEAMTAALESFPFGTAVALQEDRAVNFGLRSQLQARRHPRYSSPVQFFEGIPEYMLPSTDAAAEVRAFHTEIANEVASINDRDGVLIIQTVTGGLTANGLTGREKPYMVALRAAAARASMGPGKSLTHATIGGTAPFPNLREQTDAFVRSGALVIEAPRRNAPARVVLGRTSYVGQDNLAYESEKTVAIMNALTRDFRAIGEATVPGAGSSAALADYQRKLDTRCDKAVEQGWLTDGVDANGQPLAAYENDVLTTKYQGRLVAAVSKLNPTPEFLMTDHDIVARTVEIEVNL